jgi:hypothetical protein
MLRVALILTPLTLAIAVACGDSGGSDSSNPNTNSGGDSSANNGGAETNQAGQAATAGTNNTGGSSSNGGSSNGGGATSEGGTPAAMGGAPNEAMGGADTSAGGADTGAGGAAACPDLFGDYNIKSAVGMCGTLNKNAPQSIEGNDVDCAAHFVSTPAKGEPGINGGATLDAKGDFKNAKLTLGGMQRSPCTGTYAAAAGTMTVECGGVGDACTVVLTKK